MASKISRKEVVLLLGAMLAVHAIVLKQEWREIPIRTDFSIFYTAGKIVAEHRGRQLYDYPLQESVQRSSILRGVQKSDFILPYNHLPFEALLFVPLSLLPYLPAYLVWLGINLGLLIVAGISLRRHLPLLRAAPLWLWVLACLAYSPIFITLMLGQDSILLLLCYCLAWVALVKKSEFAAGAWLGLGLCKYHLVLPFLLAFLLERRAKVIAGFLTVAVILGLISFAVVGRQGIVSYPRFLWNSERNARPQWNAAQPNLHGFFVTTLGNSGWVQVLVLATSVLLVAVAWYGWRNTGSSHLWPGELSFAVNLVMTLLVSYHAYVQDLSLLFFVLLLGLDVLIAKPALPRLVHSILLVCLSILFFSPIYLVLILRFGNLEVLTPILLLFFFALVSAIAWLRRSGSRTSDVVTPGVS
jgi:Glycosyltransferase family 87